MSRFVKPRPHHPPAIPATAPLGAPAPTEQDAGGSPAERIVKYVPVEIVSGYVFVLGLAQAVPIGVPQTIAVWACLLAGCVATPLYLLAQKPQPGQGPQVWIASFAFLLWAYLLGGPFAAEPLKPYYYPSLGSVVVGLYTWLVGLFYVPRET